MARNTPVPRTDTIADVVPGQIRIVEDDLTPGLIHFYQDYKLEDETGSIYTDRVSLVLEVAVQFSALPASVRTGLTEMRDYLYNRTLVKEGL